MGMDIIETYNGLQKMPYVVMYVWMDAQHVWMHSLTGDSKSSIHALMTLHLPTNWPDNSNHDVM